MIWIDSNTLMYLVGGPHPNKFQAQNLLHRLTANRERLVTDAEVLQEILHRYTAINRRDAIQPAFDALLGLVDEVFDVSQGALERAKQIVLSYNQLSARDAVHLAIMEQQGVEQVLSFDRGFDRFPKISRVQ